MVPPIKSSDRRGFVLFLVCTLAFLMMIMIIGLSRHKSGAVFQLNKTIEQERGVLLAQAGVNEMLAWVKAGVNNGNTTIGNSIQTFWKEKSAGHFPKVIFQAEFNPDTLKATNQLVVDYLGNRGEVSGKASILLSEQVKGGRRSFIGHLELIGKTTYKDLPAEIAIKERREIKIIDLSDPFVDKYALFVKSFCQSINNPKKRLIIRGIAPNDPTKYSFIYLGNRSYPACKEFPQGSKSAGTPPILLDLHFKEDSHLLGSFYQPGSFQTVNKENSDLSNGNLFFVYPPVPFSSISGSFSPNTDFHTTPELVSFYKLLVDTSSQYSKTEGSLGYQIKKDFEKSGGNPAASDIFRSVVQALMVQWKYHYGYSDFSCIAGENGGKTFTDSPIFSGILDYFREVSQTNPQRAIGGQMPLLFGEKRNTPVYIEGPVYLRFFKIAFLDETSVDLHLFGGKSTKVPFSPVPMRYEKAPRTFSGKPLSPPLDDQTQNLMSTPMDSVSINNLFFGTGNAAVKTPTCVKGNIEGYDVFPTLDESLHSVAHFYQTADEFLGDRLKMIHGLKTLDLDGISLIMGEDGKALDLSSVEKYRGKGRIVVAEGNCHIGDLFPNSLQNDSLSIYLMGGRYVLTSNSAVVNIFASLAATTLFKDNSSCLASSEGGIEFEGKSVNIYGNLIIDNLLEMHKMPEHGFLKIVHDPKLLFPEYPVRVSIGETRSLLGIDYHAE
jgi:hypothetical protein